MYEAKWPGGTGLTRARVVAALTAISMGVVADELSDLSVAGLSPAFDPAVTNCPVPKSGQCSIPVAAILAAPFPIAGQTVEQDLGALIDNVFPYPNVPPFVATRLNRALVASNPCPGYIQRIADVFADNGQGVRGDLRAVLKSIPSHPIASYSS